MLKVSSFLFLLISIADASVILHRNARVAGGKPVDILDYPYQVSVIIDGLHLCGGTIISQNFIITAAHCVDGETNADIKVQAGVTSIDVEDGKTTASEDNLYKVDEIYEHPKFSLWNYEYDVAILKLAEKLPENEKMKRIGLPNETDDIPVGKTATVTGWGATLERSNDFSTQLLATDVVIISSEECMKDYPYDEITHRMVCAGEGENDSCLGDSGGPLAVGNTLIGVISWGYACGEVGHPGVYTSIIAVRDFIENIAGI